MSNTHIKFGFKDPWLGCTTKSGLHGRSGKNARKEVIKNYSQGAASKKIEKIFKQEFVKFKR